MMTTILTYNDYHSTCKLLYRTADKTENHYKSQQLPNAIPYKLHTNLGLSHYSIFSQSDDFFTQNFLGFNNSIM